MQRVTFGLADAGKVSFSKHIGGKKAAVILQPLIDCVDPVGRRGKSRRQGCHIIIHHMVLNCRAASSRLFRFVKDGR